MICDSVIETDGRRRHRAAKIFFGFVSVAVGKPELTINILNRERCGIYTFSG